MPTTTNAAVFAANLNAYGQTLRLQAEKVLNGITFMVYADLVEPWPVDTGRSRAGWMISVYVAGSDVPPPGRHGKPDATQFLSVLAGAPLEATRVIFDNVDYSVWIEFGNSRRAGLHIVSLVVSRWRQRLKSGGS